MGFATFALALACEAISPHHPKGMIPKAEPEPGIAFLEYGDFGPQAMAQDFLGNEWCPWTAPCGEGDARERYEKAHPRPKGAAAGECLVRVVVFQGKKRAALEKQYADVPYQVDYRLVSYADAKAYLDARLKELQGIRADETALVELNERLEQTAFTLKRRLGAKK